MAYKQKSRRSNSPLNISRELSKGGDVLDETAQRSGSFMSKHTQSGLNYGSPLHAAMVGDAPEKTAKEKLADAKEARKAPRKAVRDARKDVKTENKATRQKERAANKAGRVEKRQGRKDYRQAKSDIKTGERQEWADETKFDSDSGLSSYKIKGKVKLDRKAIREQARETAAEKAAKRAKK